MLAINLLMFGRLLRRAGLEIHGGRLLDAIEALSIVGVASRTDARLVLRTFLVHRREDLPIFDRAFDLFFRRQGAPGGRADLKSLGDARSRVELRFEAPGLADLAAAKEASVEPRRELLRSHQRWSAREAFRQKSFAAYTDEEIRAAADAMAQLRWSPGVRRTRRRTPGSGRLLDLRRAMRQNVTSGGEILHLPRLVRRERVRPLVVIADVSGSMERYSRMLLHFAHLLVRDSRKVEAFLFATRLTRITMPLRRSSPDVAIRAVSHSVMDWAGGTRIGDSIRAFNLSWGRRVLAGGAVVLLVSDGWDRGDPERLAAEMAHLRRSCHRVIWLNPLLGTPGYEPVTRGMAAALPHVDDFLPVHNLASIEALARSLNEL
jgi:uncharacterized protein with von Willebrand factor type A (vWA) domain